MLKSEIKRNNVKREINCFEFYEKGKIKTKRKEGEFSTVKINELN